MVMTWIIMIPAIIAISSQGKSFLNLLRCYFFLRLYIISYSRLKDSIMGTLHWIPFAFLSFTIKVSVFTSVSEY